MKRHIIAATTAALVGVGSALAQGEWLEKTHDFGLIAEDGGKVYCDFRLVNRGTEPIGVIDVRANCGCTRPEYSREPVAPGDTLTIHVGFNPSERPGQFVKHINVDLDSEPTRTSLTICGTVAGTDRTLTTRYPIALGPARLATTSLPYGRLTKGTASGQYLEAVNASADTIRPRLEGVPPHIFMAVDPAVVAPGERFIVSTIFYTNKCDDWGISTGHFTLYPDADSTEGVDIETIAIIDEDFSALTPKQLAEAPAVDVDPVAIDLERLSRRAGVQTREFTVSNTGKSPLIVRALDCSDPAVTLTMKNRTIKPGKKEKIIVTVDPLAVRSARLLNARVNLTTNAPASPQTTLRIVAEMTD